MAWNPSTNIIDVTKITDNLFDYLEANQVDALEWANPDSSLKPIQKFYRSAVGRIMTIFPCLMLLDKANATDNSQDVLEGRFRLQFEGVIKGGDTEELVKNATFYAAALESMLAEVPSEVLTVGAKQITFARNDSLETEYDVISRNPGKANIYFQVFRTEVTYALRTSAYTEQ